jgi:hypothetical protein
MRGHEAGRVVTGGIDERPSSSGLAAAGTTEGRRHKKKRRQKPQGPRRPYLLHRVRSFNIVLRPNIILRHRNPFAPPPLPAQADRHLKKGAKGKVRPPVSWLL